MPTPPHRPPPWANFQNLGATRRIVLWAMRVLLGATLAILVLSEARGTSEPYVRGMLAAAALYLTVLLASRGRAQTLLLRLTPFFGAALALLTLAVLQAAASPSDYRQSHALLGAYVGLPVIYALFFLLLPSRAALWASLVTCGGAVALQLVYPPAVGDRVVLPLWVAILTGVWHGALILLSFSVPRLRSDRDLLASVLQGSRDAILVLEAERGADGAVRDFRVALANDRATRLLGARAGTRLLELEPDHEENGLLARFAEVLASGVEFRADVPLLAEPAERWFSVTAVPLQDGVTVTYADVTERIRDVHRTRTLAYTDPLTGLANRRAFEEQGSWRMGEAARAGRPVMLCFLDLDGFKAVNDRWGHAAGDELLRQVAGRLRGAVREADLIARFAGDEFALLVEGLDPAAAEPFFRRLAAAFDPAFTLDAEPLRVRPSIGVAAAGSAELGPALRAADAAMYRAKQRGGGVEMVSAGEA